MTKDEAKARVEAILRDRFDCSVILIPADINEATREIMELFFAEDAANPNKPRAEPLGGDAFVHV